MSFPRTRSSDFMHSLRRARLHVQLSLCGRRRVRWLSSVGFRGSWLTRPGALELSGFPRPRRQSPRLRTLSHPHPPHHLTSAPPPLSYHYIMSPAGKPALTFPSGLPLASESPNAQGHDLPREFVLVLALPSWPELDRALISASSRSPCASACSPVANAFTLHQTAQLEGLLTVIRDRETGR